MNEQLIDKLISNINEAFSEKFDFPKDFVSARTNESGDLILRIGWRDIQLSSDGSFVGQGTDLSLSDKYKIITA